MAMTPEELQQGEAEFADAYAEDTQPAAEQSEDEAFGLTPEAEPEPEAGAEAGPLEAAVIDDAAAAGEVAGETATEAQGDEPGVDDGETRDADELQGEVNGSADGADSGAPGAATEEAVDMDKERQRLKSWEGRLKKIEAELAKKSVEPVIAEVAADEPVADALEQVADEAEAQGDDALDAAAEKAADAVESGELTAEQAMKQLAEDFGEDFVRMIEVIAGAKAKQAGESAAGERIGEIGKAVDEIIEDIVDNKARAHFEAIAAAHPDFDDIGRSEGFAKFVESSENADEARRIVASGSAKEIVKLLGDYKASLASSSADEAAAADEPAADPVVDQATEQQMSDAEGVRSSGMKLPEQPAPAATSYEDAWKEFA